ncbi:hypothetical protein GS416_05505 [Rhodococcus hoagii]|nr:hypothetical protein [Prescottella equi]
MTRAAEIIGAAGTAARRSLRHLVDRELQRWGTRKLSGAPAGVRSAGWPQMRPCSLCRLQRPRAPATGASRRRPPARGLPHGPRRRRPALDSTVHGAVAG